MQFKDGETRHLNWAPGLPGINAKVSLTANANEALLTDFQYNFRPLQSREENISKSSTVRGFAGLEGLLTILSADGERSKTEAVAERGIHVGLSVCQIRSDQGMIAWEYEGERYVIS